jgi:hypothetical protein
VLSPSAESVDALPKTEDISSRSHVASGLHCHSVGLVVCLSRPVDYGQLWCLVSGRASDASEVVGRLCVAKVTQDDCWESATFIIISPTHEHVLKLDYKAKGSSQFNVSGIILGYTL